MIAEKYVNASFAILEILRNCKPLTDRNGIEKFGIFYDDVEKVMANIPPEQFVEKLEVKPKEVE